MKNVISQLIEDGTNVQINVTASELKGFAIDILKEFNASIQKPAEETYISVKQASQQLGVDRSTLWRWNKECYLLQVKIGSKIRYKQSDIDKIKQKA